MPPTLDQILTPQAKDALHHLELFARRTVSGILHGVHKSKRLGVSTEFDHHKSYQVGDPLKHIDWKVSARHDATYVKRYLEDTALTVRIVVDRSASMGMTTGDDARFDQAQKLAACLAYLIINQGDSAGLVTASADGAKWLPPGSTQRHLVQMLTMLATSEPTQRDALGECLGAVLERGEKRGLIAVVSDLMFDPAPVQRILASLMAQGHEVLLFQLRDATEEDFPFNRWVEFRDLEQAGVKHRVDAVLLRQLYRETYSQLVDNWKTWARKYDAHFVSARTDGTMQTLLSNYLVFRSGTGR